MALTEKQVQTFFESAGQPITDRQMVRVMAAMKTQRYGRDDAGAEKDPSADDLTDWLFRQLRDFVNRITAQEAAAAAAPAREDLL